MRASTPLDFSQYGTLSKEWMEYQEANPDLVRAVPDLQSTPPAELQAVVNAMVAEATKAKMEKSGLWNVVESQDHFVTGRDGSAIPLRCYRPKRLQGKTLPVHVYHHGGGFIFGSLESEEPMCAAWAHQLSMAVISVNYRHTPQVSGLAAWHDGIDAFEWIARNTTTLGVDPGRITIGGISAGGAIAAAVGVHEVRQAKEAGTTPRFKGQVLGIPTLFQEVPYHMFVDKEKTSRVQNADKPILHKESLNYFFELLRKDTDVPLDHPTWNPAFTEKEVLQHMPRTVILANGADTLRDDALVYATRLQDAG